MIDLYGNCTSVELVDMRRSLNNFVGDFQLQQEEDDVSEDSEDSPQHGPESDTVENVSNTLNNLTVDGGEEDNDVSVPLRHNARCQFRPLSFHRVTGVNVSLDGRRSVATRSDDEYSGGYVFSEEAVRPGERLVVQVLATENMYIGSLAFGLTSCDPTSLEGGEELPEDADMLLDRSEYWVVSKDVASAPDTWDELSFLVNSDGSVEFSRNSGPPSVLMHVDTSVPLWAFWDVYGNTQRLRLVGATTARLEPGQDSQHASRENDRNNHVMTDSMIESASHQPPPLPPRSRSSHNIAGPPPPSASGEECKICYEAPVDCVLYVCGHMCLCYQVTSTTTTTTTMAVTSQYFSVLSSSGRAEAVVSVPCAGRPFRTLSRYTDPRGGGWRSSHWPLVSSWHIKRQSFFSCEMSSVIFKMLELCIFKLQR